MRYTAHSPWSGTSSLTGNSPLTPPAQYGVPHSPHAVAPHYSPVVMPQYQYPPHAAAYTHPASQPQLGPTSASPNSNFHMFQSSSRENLSLPPIRSTHNVQRARLPSVPVHPWCTADATGLGVQMPPPMTNGVTYGGTQGIPTGNSAIYDASRGCYVDTLAGRSQYHDDHRAWGPGVAIKNE